MGARCVTDVKDEYYQLKGAEKGSKSSQCGVDTVVCEGQGRSVQLSGLCLMLVQMWKPLCRAGVDHLH